MLGANVNVETELFLGVVFEFLSASLVFSAGSLPLISEMIGSSVKLNLAYVTVLDEVEAVAGFSVLVVEATSGDCVWEIFLRSETGVSVKFWPLSQSKPGVILFDDGSGIAPGVAG